MIFIALPFRFQNYQAQNVIYKARFIDHKCDAQRKRAQWFDSGEALTNSKFHANTEFAA